MTKSVPVERRRQVCVVACRRASAGVGVGGARLAELDRFHEDRRAICRLRLLQLRRRDVVQPRLVAGRHGGMRDAMPHRAGAEHCQCPYIHRQSVSDV